ncbi:type II toxin-antitoxin system HicB family antitoxin [Nocardiopsis sp. L17-MgMaSL7]|uniref:type II toxin-antitoxin system HicB family antitoxin n=1 Tax=Nocardiopsis sp. L17-MgMaSL7 TaxID=1938893 RepID=UPI000D716464|nr:type II toxin-antitoxin system HicB family antitoxin [Nocardiopsis sp. L17-MgMaSL7]PWV51012.1 hypothetical protein BDW27_10778 [Nocardiopsis sp. L17-MgMaSL7]
MHRTLHLAVTVTPDHEAGGYVARAVDVEVASQGETEQEALDALIEALELYFEDDEDAVRQLAETPTRVTEIDVRLPA